MTRTHFDEQLELLNKRLTEMGTLCVNAIEKTAKAVELKDSILAKTVIEMETIIDEKEKEIENICLKLLLKQQPVARDLRMISAALKMITDMERIGDQARDISEIVIYLAEKPALKEPIDILDMAKGTMEMVTCSIEAYVKQDLQRAKAVIAYDDTIDDLFSRIRTELVEILKTDATKAEQSLDYLMVAKYFERIGDHATNIAEWVAFSIVGEHKD